MPWDPAADYPSAYALGMPGHTARGGRHLIWGTPVDVSDSFADEYVLAAIERGR
ncbi:hypothetical protein GCM10009610_71800 [Pseudonocardia xinjiangensis]